MRNTSKNGLTLVELLASIAIMAIIATTAIPLLSTSLDVYSQGLDRSQLYQEGLRAMERITTSVRKSTFLNIPNAHNDTRNVLAFSGIFDTDGDYYFDNNIFPRISEDVPADMNADGMNGIAGVDDDGDGKVDERAVDEGAGNLDEDDDDEDGLVNEDPLDGIDNDTDGNIDEDCGGDMHNDGAPGIVDIDDNADGNVDEGNVNDDDEDGDASIERLIQLVYWIPSGTTLREDNLYSGENRALSDHATKFEVKYDSELPGLIEINLELTGDDGEKIEFKEHAYARNTHQRMGKKVR